MPRHASADVRQLRHLSTQYRAEADDLRDQLARFRQQTEVTAGAYGDTADAEHARRAHQDTSAQVQDELTHMHGELVATADRLEVLAGHFTSVMADATDTVAGPDTR